MRVIPIFLVLVSLIGSPAGAQDTLAPEPWKKAVAALRDSMKPSDPLGEVPVPLLQAVAAIRKWGTPYFERNSDGGYSIAYTNPDPKHPFDRVIILASPKPIPNLSAVPEMEELAEVDGELATVKKPQAGKSVVVKWRTPEGAVARTIRYFRHDTGGGANGALDMTDAFSITSGGKTGYYVVSVETVAEETEKRLKMLEVVR